MSEYESDALMLFYQSLRPDATRQCRESSHARYFMTKQSNPTRSNYDSAHHDVQDFASHSAFMSLIRQLVRSARDAQSMTQVELAIKANVGRSTVVKIERGDDVSVSSLAKVADALGLELALRKNDERFII